MTKPKISILLPAYKSKELLAKVFLPSWRKNTQVETEIIIYDNGGNGIFRNCFVKTQITEIEKNVKVIGDGQNIGLNSALNKCSEIATGDYFYLPHTDMYLMPGWGTALLDAVKNQPPGRQLLCSRSIEPTKGHTDFHIIKNYGKEWNEFQEDKLINDFAEYKNHDIRYGLRMPIFLDKFLWKKLEDFNLHNFDKKEALDTNYFSYAHENDLIINSYHLGVRKFWMVYSSLVYHLQGKSNAKQNVDKGSDKPYQYLRGKWLKFGYKIGHIDTFEQSLFPWYYKAR